MNIALFTPSKNPYSETFIQAHKNRLPGKVFYFYGKRGHINLEGKILKNNSIDRIGFKIKKKIGIEKNKSFNDLQILKALKKYKIEKILIEYGTHAYNLQPLLLKCKLPLVVHFHGYDASKKEVLTNTNNYKEVFLNASKIITVSRVMEQKLLHLGCPKEKMVYNVYGPQPEFLTLQPTFSKKQLIAIGRFTDKKAPYYTILAFQKVLLKHPDATLLMAGEGQLLETCKNLVKHLQIEKQVQFLGVITPQQYRNLLTASIAFIQHSITPESGDMEGTPLAVLEASAAGVPVIATQHAGIPDVVIHNTTGLLCEEHDVTTMAQHIDALLSDVALAQQMGAAAKANITQHFTLQRHIALLYQTLKEASLS